MHVTTCTPAPPRAKLMLYYDNYIKMCDNEHSKTMAIQLENLVPLSVTGQGFHYMPSSSCGSQ